MQCFYFLNRLLPRDDLSSARVIQCNQQRVFVLQFDMIKLTIVSFVCFVLVSSVRIVGMRSSHNTSRYSKYAMITRGPCSGSVDQSRYDVIY